jgi:hypothetical protein
LHAGISSIFYAISHEKHPIYDHLWVMSQLATFDLQGNVAVAQALGSAVAGGSHTAVVAFCLGGVLLAVDSAKHQSI